MKLTTIATSLALVASALAAPAVRLDSPQESQCLCQQDAETFLNRFIPAFQHLPDIPTANKTLQEIVAPHFVDISDSILSLEGRPVSHHWLPTEQDESSFNVIIHYRLRKNVHD